VTNANAIHGGVRDEFNLSSRVYVFGFADFDETPCRISISAMCSAVVWATTSSNARRLSSTCLVVPASIRNIFLSYTTANPVPPPELILVGSQSRRSAEIVAGESLSTKLGSRTTVSEQLSFFPNLSSTGDYRVTFDANATTKINSWLGWQVMFSDRYISNPPLGLKGNDLLMSTGLRVTLAREHSKAE